MTFHADPLFQAMLRDAHAHASAKAAQLAATWLIDDCDPAPALLDLLQWYAGSPPAFYEPRWETAEGKFRILREWQALRGGREMAERSLDIQGGANGMILFRVYPLAWQEAFALICHKQVDFETMEQGWTIGTLTVGVSNVSAAINLETARAVRESKRRVLGLFPEVKLTRECRVPLTWPAAARTVGTEFGRVSRFDASSEQLIASGFNLEETPERIQIYERFDVASKCVVYTQELTAPHWIPPEPTDAGVYRAGYHGPVVRYPPGPRPEPAPEGFPHREIIDDMVRYGIDVCNGEFHEMHPQRLPEGSMGMSLICNCQMPPLHTRLRDLPVGPVARISEIHLRFAPCAFASNRYHWQTRYWYGQCPHCRTIYWCRGEEVRETLPTFGRVP